MLPSLFAPSALRAAPSTTRLFTTSASLAITLPTRPSTTTTSTRAPSTTASPINRLGNIMNNRSAAPPASRAADKASAKNGNDAAMRMLARHRMKNAGHAKGQLAMSETAKELKTAKDLQKQMPRRWKAGDVYAPHDLSSVEMQKWKKRSPRVGDVVDALNLSPLDLYKNFSLIKYFTSSSGQILPQKDTKLRPVNQRKIAKMIRRVQGMGLYPSIHSHPEMIRSDFFPNHRY